MKPKEFIHRLDEVRIISAIAEAERKSSGEIRVYVSHRKRIDPLAFAQKRFLQLGMTKTRHRNAVLIYLVPHTRQFAVVGDQGVHEKCGEQFWQRVVDGMRVHFQNERFSHALIEAVNEVGKVLAAHFPRTSANANELSDEIVES